MINFVSMAVFSKSQGNIFLFFFNATAYTYLIVLAHVGIRKNSSSSENACLIASSSIAIFNVSYKGCFFVNFPRF